MLVARRPEDRVLNYRPDIDGLRAIAVLAVVGYHAFPRLITGGFVGVDVFFVISGFLICTIVHDDIRAGRFSFLTFYEHRIRRLFPALFVVLAACTVAAWVMFLPQDMKNFGQSLLAASLYFSNILFFIDTGYFDTAAEFKPLLHTWSLAVEEQFYMIFPLILLIGMTHLNRRVAFILIMLGIASFAASIWQVERDPAAAFYLLPGRFWELLLGATLVFVPVPQNRAKLLGDISAALGLALIVAPTLIYTDQSPFPGLLALLPCAGTALVIHTGVRQPGIIHRMLSFRIAVFVGLISYSLYLWHWPVLVFAKYYAVRPLTMNETVLAVAIALLLATLSWRLVERPFRHKAGWLGQSAIYKSAVAASVVAVAIGFSVHYFDGIASRIPAEIRALNSEDPHMHARRDCHFADRKKRVTDFCVRGAQDVSPQFMLLGDSHADMHGPGVFAAAAALGISGVQFTDYGYVPAPGFAIAGARDRYAQNYDMLTKILDHYPDIDVIVYGLFWNQALGYPIATAQDGQKRDLGDAVAALIDAYPEKKFLLLEDVPNSVVLGPAGLARAAYLNSATAMVPWPAYLRQLEVHRPVLNELSSAPNATSVPVAGALCDPVGCKGLDEGVLLYRDTDHLSEVASQRMEPFFHALLAEALGLLDTVEIQP